MPKNEDGEFELVLGNKQLLSMFFVVVVLLGVFFVMGYIVGRNSAPLVNSEATNARRGDTKPLVVDSPAPKPAPTPETEAPPPVSEPPKQTAVETPAETKPEPPKLEPAPKAKPAPSKPEPAPKREVAKAENPRPPASGKAAQNEQPVTGKTYLQLVATTKHDADAYVETLRKNSFPALAAEVPEKPGLFRVLVGPLAPGDVNKMKDELQNKGIQAKSAIRKTF